MNKDRLALDFLGKAKEYIEKAFPGDKKLISYIDDAIHHIAWKIYNKENGNASNSNNR